MRTGASPGGAGRVLVAVDGSTNAMRAVRVAVRAAELRGVGLDVVHVAAPTLLRGSEDPYLLDDAVTTARAHASGLDVRAVRRTGPVAPVLAELTRACDVLILGSRGHSAMNDAFLGSVALDVIARAAGPVIVVRPDAAVIPTGAGSVVAAVAVEDDDAVLGHAFGQAALLGVPLRIVCGVGRREGIRRLVRDVGRSLGAAHQDPNPAPRGWQDRYPDVAVRVEDSPQAPARAVIDAARDATLIVAGSHGRGPRTGWLLGSVSQAILHDAPCPVAIVPPSWR